MEIKLTTLFVAFAFCTTGNAVDSFRCDNHIIDVGASLAHVLVVCGQPGVHVGGSAPVRSRNSRGYSFVSGFLGTDQLIYYRGWGRSPVELDFSNGRLRHINYLPRQ